MYKQSFSDAVLIYQQDSNTTKVAIFETRNTLCRFVIENSKWFSCSVGREKCGFFIFKHDKRIGRSYKTDEIEVLFSKDKVTLKNCTSSKGDKYSAVFSLQGTGKHVNLRMEELVGGKKRKSA